MTAAAAAADDAAAADVGHVVASGGHCFDSDHLCPVGSCWVCWFAQTTIFLDRGRCDSASRCAVAAAASSIVAASAGAHDFVPP